MSIKEENIQFCFLKGNQKPKKKKIEILYMSFLRITKVLIVLKIYGIIIKKQNTMINTLSVNLLIIFFKVKIEGLTDDDNVAKFDDKSLGELKIASLSC